MHLQCQRKSGREVGLSPGFMNGLGSVSLEGAIGYSRQAVYA
jgi:hypothetical protein